jgi:5-formyltetrahydrofolate cyclo-ligase
MTATVISKQALRQTIRERRRQQSPHEEADRNIQEHALSWLNAVSPSTIGCYCSVAGEAATDQILRESHAQGLTVVVPRYQSDKAGYEWVRWTPSTAMQAGRWDIPEPAIADRINPQQLEAALIPAMAMDRQGHRLGHGGGYFDRLLAALNCPTAALVYEWQLLDEIPEEPHDRRVDAVITERGVLNANKNFKPTTTMNNQEETQ